jgi:hypothetical protein
VSGVDTEESMEVVMVDRILSDDATDREENNQIDDARYIRNHLNTIVVANTTSLAPNTLKFNQCCGFGVFIPDPNLFHPSSLISDPGSNHKQKWGGGKIFFFSPFLQP